MLHPFEHQVLDINTDCYGPNIVERTVPGTLTTNTLPETPYARLLRTPLLPLGKSMIENACRLIRHFISQSIQIPLSV